MEEEGEDKSFVRFWKERESPSTNNSRNFAQTSIATRLFSRGFIQSRSSDSAHGV